MNRIYKLALDIINNAVRSKQPFDRLIYVLKSMLD